MKGRIRFYITEVVGALALIAFISMILLSGLAFIN